MQPARVRPVILVTFAALACDNHSAPSGVEGALGAASVSDPGVVLIAAGDIAECAKSGGQATAALLDGIPGSIVVLGDNAYEKGTLAEHKNCYEPTWGRHKSRTRPAVGNHEYKTAGASGYWDYWGNAAGVRGQGYYSFDLGDWHIVALNSNCSIVSCVAGSAQEQWLRADLAAHPKKCTLAFFHHPRFNSGASHGNNTKVRPLWRALYDARADVILNGHEHLYERFAPQTPAGVANSKRGIRQFTVGTGGRALYQFGTVQPNSEVRQNRALGVLKLTLKATSYTWEFVPVAGQTFEDKGAGTCH